AWNRNLEAQLGVRADLRSLDGSELLDERERVVVFDGTPHAVSRGAHRVAAGQPLALYFDNPVSAANLRGDVMAYEVGGGARSLPFTLRSRGREDALFRVDLVPSRSLEAGSNIGVALAPRWWTWAGGTPGVMRFMVQPPPQIEGVGCSADARARSGCSFGAAPGRVVDIESQLGILASEELGDAASTFFSVSPRLPGARLVRGPSGRVLSLEGEWAPDQVYEVRFGELHAASGAPLQRMGPLAVRSRGRTPSVSVQGGAARLSYELGADPLLHLTGINVRKGALVYRAVAPNELMDAALAPASFLRATHQDDAFTPMVDLIPDARANRPGRGTYRWRDESRSASTAVVGFRAGESGSSVTPMFLQRTDLAPTVQTLEDGVQVWLTRLSDGSPVDGARVVVRAAGQDAEALEGTTDSDGLVFLPTEDSLLGARLGVAAFKEDDQVALVVEHSRAIGPARLGIYAGGDTSLAGDSIAAVMSDRGAYRPGTTVRASAAIRSTDGSNVAAIAGEEFILRLTSPSQQSPIAEALAQSSEFGFVHAEFELPQTSALGNYVVSVHRPETTDAAEEQLGQTSIRVANFRQPSFRVDAQGPALVMTDETPSFTVDASYLFGAPVADAEVEWSLLRRGPARAASEYRGFVFGPVDATVSPRTEHSGSARTGADGRVSFETALVSGARRERLTLEVEVRDPTGQSTAAHHDLTLQPAAFEIGLESGDAWVDAGETLELRAVVLDPEGTALAGQNVRGRILREGWHGWWEWHGGESSGYRVRRDQRSETVHTCRFESADASAEAAGCDFVPARPGTYVLEVEAEDGEGRKTIASRRLYVAGPGEYPDRDAPGAPIAVTPQRLSYQVGDTALVAFESPWEGAQALLTVQRDGVLHHQRMEVQSGGNTLEIPIDDTMTPNVYLTLTLLRGRDGEPQASGDPGSPDLRYGATEISVRPAGQSLEVTIEAATNAAPGEEVDVEALVSRGGAAARAEVTLWAVDEGLLRLTDYEPSNLSAGLFPRRSASFSWEDVRRGLVSRIIPEQWRAGGDGGESAGGRVLRPDETYPEPVPLWAPGLMTDEDGRVRATIRLPERATEYRIMAIAMDEAAAFGKASAPLSVEAEAVLRDSLPRFATAGDTFKARFMLHATGGALSGTFEVQLGNERHERRVELEEGASASFEFDVTAPNRDALRIRSRFGEVHTDRTLRIAPRARWNRRIAYGAVQGAHGSPTNPGITLRFPNVERGHARIHVATHPFLGFDALPARIAESPWQSVEDRASRVLLLAASQELASGLSSADNHRIGAPGEHEERMTRGNDAVEHLLRIQLEDGAFGRWASSGWSSPWESAMGVHALVAAKNAGFHVPSIAYTRALEWLRATIQRRPYAEYRFADADAGIAYAVRVLTEAGERAPSVTEELFERRGQLSLLARALLALAMEDAEKGEQNTLALEVADYAMNDHTADDTLPYSVRYPDLRGSVLGPIVEALAATRVGREHLGAVSQRLLAATTPHAAYGWQSSVDAAFAARGLAAYARLFRGSAIGPVTLDGVELRAESSSVDAARFEVPLAALGGADHLVVLESPSDAPLFFSVESDYAEALNATDYVARGARVAIHRRYELIDGRPVTGDTELPLGTMVRVRLFVYSESPSQHPVAIHDPLAAGFEPIEDAFNTSAHDAVASMLGAGPSDDARDPRGYHAYRSAGSITHRALERNAAVFTLESLPARLQEYTYVVRATTPGHFTAPPAQIESERDPSFVARSAVHELSVAAPTSAAAP
ncbi:MAG: alpha-2-macroglobulin, partial [Polyangiales bacterium]